MAFKFDPQTGSVVDDNSSEPKGYGIPQEVIDTDNIPMLDPSGKPVWIGKAQLSNAINSGYKYESPIAEKERKDAEKYGTLPEVLKTVAESAASVPSFGLSRVAEIEAGISAEEQEARKKENPFASDVGTGIGLVGSLLAPELAVARGALGKTAAVVSAPVKGVTKLAEGISGAALPGATRGAQAILGEGAMSQIAAKAAATGMGSAVEGAIYGAGQAIDETALGESHDLAESLLSNVGFGALFGGGAGAVMGGIGGAYSQLAKPKGVDPVAALAEVGIHSKPSLTTVEELAQYGAPNDAPPLKSVIGYDEFVDKSKQALDAGLNQTKKNVDEIMDAARSLDLPVFDEMATDNPIVQKAGEVARNTNTVLGAQRSVVYNNAWNNAVEQAKSVLGPATVESRAELGGAIQNSMADSFAKRGEGIKALYEYIAPYREAITVSKKAAKSAVADIMEIAKKEFVQGTPEYTAANVFAQAMQDIPNIDRLAKIRTALARSTDKETRFVSKIIKEKLDDLEEASVESFARRMQTSEAKEKILDLIDQSKAAKSVYKTFMEDAETIGAGALGRKKIYGPQDLLDAINDITPEKFAKRLFQKENTRFLGWMKTNFPAEVEMLKKFEKGQLITKHTKADGTFNARGLIKEIDGFEKEYRNTLFSPDELKKIKDVETYINAFPKTFNPSGTAHMAEFYKSLESPLKMAAANAYQLAAAKLVKSGNTLDVAAQYLTALEKSQNKVRQKIASKAAAIFKELKDVVVPGAMLFKPTEEKKKRKDKELHSSLMDLGNNPLKLMALIEERTKDLEAVAPNASMAMREAMVRGVSFLATKVPVQPEQSFLSDPLEATQSEIYTFNLYYDAVQNPVGILDSVKSGTITPEQVEAVSMVFPKLYSQMTTAVMDQLLSHKGKAKDLPYQTKLGLSLFLQKELVDSLSQESMQMTQVAISQESPSSGGAQGVKPTSSSLQKVNTSDRILTSMQSTAQRREA